MDLHFFRRHALSLSVFAFTLALRLFSLCRLAHSPYGVPATSDMRFYADWARRIANGELTDFHAFYAQPLYAYLLGGIFALAGFQPALVGVIQAMLDAFTALLIYQIARLTFDEKPQRGALIGLVAAAGWAFFVPSAAYSGLLIPASWMVAAWTFCIWWLLRRSETACHVEWLSIALFIGAMAMMSATILFVLPLFFARAAMRRASVFAAALVAGVIVGSSPAWLHNCFVARDRVFLSAHSGVNFWIGNNPEANGYPRVPPELSSEQAGLLADSIKVAETAAGHPLPRSAVSDFWSAKARDHIRSAPLTWLRLLALKAKNFWNRFEYDDLSSITALRDAGIVWPGISFGLIAALGLPGGVLALRNSRARWIVAVVLLQMLALLPVFVNERYRLPAAPGLLLLSAFFLAELGRAIFIFNWRRLAASAAMLALSIGFTTMSPATGEPALWSVNDYKTARRQLIAGDYPRGEVRLRRAFASMVPPAQVSVGVANGFAEIAREQSMAGEAAAAVRTIEEAIRINPADPRLRVLRQRIADGMAARP